MAKLPATPPPRAALSRPDDAGKLRDGDLPAPPQPTPSASPLRIPLALVTFAPGVSDGDGGTLDTVRADWKGRGDLAFDVALGCVTIGLLIVPVANVRSMVRAGGEK